MPEKDGSVPRLSKRATRGKKKTPLFDSVRGRKSSFPVLSRKGGQKKKAPIVGGGELQHHAHTEVTRPPKGRERGP